VANDADSSSRLCATARAESRLGTSALLGGRGGAAGWRPSVVELASCPIEVITMAGMRTSVSPDAELMVFSEMSDEQQQRRRTRPGHPLPLSWDLGARGCANSRAFGCRDFLMLKSPGAKKLKKGGAQSLVEHGARARARGSRGARVGAPCG
jgi:hypothetical protein